MCAVMASLAVCEEGRQRGTGGVVEGRKDGAGGEVRLLRGRRKSKTGGAGGFFFLGLEIGLGLGCFFVFFLMFPKLTPPLTKSV